MNTNIHKIALALSILAIMATIYVGTSFAGTTIGGNISTDGVFTVNGNSTIGDTSEDTVTINGAPTFNTTSTFALQGSETVAINRDLSANAARGIILTATPNATNYSDTYGMHINQVNNATGTNGLDGGLVIQNDDTDAAITNGIVLINGSGAAKFSTGISVNNAYLGMRIVPESPVAAAPNGFGVLIQNTSLAAPSSTNFYGLYIDNLNSAGAGTESAIAIGSGWDTDLVFADTSPRISIPDSSSYLTIVDTSNNPLVTIADVGIYGSLMAARPYKAKTISYAVLPTESNTVLTNEGAGGSITFTLPTANFGLRYTFIVTDALNVVIDPSSTNRIVSLTDTNGDSITSDTQFESITFVGISSTEWAVESCYIVGTPTTNACFGGTTVGWADSN